MLRSILAIVVGIVLIGALSYGMGKVVQNWVPEAFSGRGEDPIILSLTLAYIFVFVIMGCYITGRLAPHHPMNHAMILGVLELGLIIAGTMSQWDTTPTWFHTAALVMVLPAAWLGGRQAEIKSQQIRKI